MADDNDLNKLKETLENLSNEPLWRQEHGESIEDLSTSDVPVIKREEIVREADLNRENPEVVDEESNPQMNNDDDDPSNNEIINDIDSSLYDPGLENLQNSINDDLNFTEEHNALDNNSEQQEQEDAFSEVKDNSLELDLPDLSEPLDLFDDDQAVLAMGESSEKEDLKDEEPVGDISDSMMDQVENLIISGDLDDLSVEDVLSENKDNDFNVGDFNLSDTNSSEEEDYFDEEVEEENNNDELLFSQKKIEQINHSLLKLPRNLRLALHKILASEETSPTDIRRITDKLLRRVSPRSLANEVHAVTGQTIILPPRYQLSSGEAFERRKTSFSYVFETLAWPVLKPIMVSTVLLAVLIFMFFSFLYRPLTAGHYYRTGYAHIVKHEYDEALLNFSVAYDGWKLGAISVMGWPMQKWFFAYADAFANQRQYTLAQDMYTRLLITYPLSRRAFLTYGDFESLHRADFERADAIYAEYLNNVNSKDIEILMARSENLLRWGADDATKLDLARDVYATLIATGGLTDRTIMGLLEFSVLMNDREEIENWVAVILTKSRMKLDSKVLALTAGWFIDQDRPYDAEQLLQKALNLNDTDPILHYELARYYEQSGNLFNARNFLEQAIYLIQNRQPMTLRDTEIFIDVFRRSSSLRFKENVLDDRAQSELERAISYYENGVQRRVLGRNAFHGGMYKELGDMFYIRDRAFNLAEIYYEKALDNSFDDADLRYKRGYIAYDNDNLERAINEFSLSLDMAPGFRNTVFSLATVLANDGRYMASEAFYQDLRNKLEVERMVLSVGDSSASMVLRQENGEFLMRVYNNLGVVLNYLSQNSPHNTEITQQAQISFQQAMFLWDALSRDPETRTRVVSQELPGMNFKALLHPTTRDNANHLYDALPLFIDTPAVTWGF